MTGCTRHPPSDEPDFGAVSLVQFARLREEVGELALRRYVLAHLALLPGRLERIERAVAAVHTAEAALVVVNLRVSGAILGARRLPRLLSTLEATLDTGVPTGFAQLNAVHTEADAVAAALRRLLDGDGTTRSKTD